MKSSHAPPDTEDLLGRVNRVPRSRLRSRQATDDSDGAAGPPSAVVQSLSPVAFGLCALFVGYAGAMFLAPSQDNAFQVALLAAASAGVFAAAGFWFANRSVVGFWAEAAMTGYALLVAANGLWHLHRLGDIRQTILFVLLLVGAGVLLASIRWLVSVWVIVLSTWWWVATAFATRDELVHYGLALLAAVGLSVIAFWSRRMSLERLEEAVGRDRRSKERLKTALEDAAASEERYRLATLGSNDGIWDWDIANDRVHYSSRWKSMLGLDPEAKFDHLDHWLNRVHPADRPRVRLDLDRHLQGKTPHFECSHRLRHENGDFLWTVARGLAVLSEEGVAYRIAGSLTNITNRGSHDQLTGLPNRSQQLSRTAIALARMRREPRQTLAVVALDIDRFRGVIDSLGHAAGDELLIAVSQRLDATIRGGSGTVQGLVTRDNADEFLMVLEEVEGIGAIQAIADFIHREFEHPFEIQGNEIFVTACLGIAIASQSTGPELLVERAGAALHRAKSKGVGRTEFFDPKFLDQAQTKLTLDSDLRRAIDRGEFVVHYQPIFALASGAVTGFEALARWQHPDKGLLAPGHFIPAAEDSELVIRIDQFVLRQACLQLKQWKSSFGVGSDLSMHVNLSARHFRKPGLAQEIAAVLHEVEVDPGCLVIEITESLLLEATDQVIQELKSLRSAGIHISLDDFGTGYSSLSHLHRLPIDRIKIDRSFIHELGGGGPATQVIRAILSLGDYLSLDVVAEGVENSDQNDHLLAMGCRYAQGFFLSRPASSDETGELLKVKEEKSASS